MKELSTRRPLYSRSEYESHEDFEVMLKMKATGMTFDEITNALNSKRDYITTVKDNRSLYFKLMKSYALTKKAQEAAEEEKDRILDDLDWIASEAQKKWQSLKNIDFVDEISGRVDDYDEEVSEDSEEISEPAPQKKKYSKKKIGLLEQHQAKYLDILLKVSMARAKITGLEQIESKDLSLIELLKSRTLDDGGRANTPALKSEEEVRALYLGTTPTFIIEDNIEIQTLDEYEADRGT